MAHYKRFLLGLFVILALALPGQASMIFEEDFLPLEPHFVHSGLGQIDLLLFTNANGKGVTENRLKQGNITLFDGDDANTDMPTGNKTTALESYITSVGELRDFYRLSFPDGEGGSTIDQLVIFIDLNQSGKGQGEDYILLDDLKIIMNFDQIGNASDDRNAPWTKDISSSMQNSTGSGFTGGTVLSELAAPFQLTVTNTGSGFADYGVLTGINPFDENLDDDTRLLFMWQSSNHHGGGTDIFLSGTYSGVGVPEPATIAMLAGGGAVLLLRRRK
jgi:hypothetical protein